MDDMEQKINSILANPQMMSQLMSMAQSLSGVQPEPEVPQQEQQKPVQQQKLSQITGGLDINMLQKVARIAQKSSIDKNQQALHKALSPYLTKARIEKLERAMRAAKIAGLATTVLGSSGLLSQTSR